MTSGSDPLLARAVACLRRREHSRQELQRKLATLAESPEQLESVLDRLEARGLLSDQRYAESVARVRGARFGPARIRHELQQKGVATETVQSIVVSLQQSEDQHLQAVWGRKFGEPPTTQAEAARQHRFLMQRGFSSDAIHRLLRSLATR